MADHTDVLRFVESLSREQFVELVAEVRQVLQDATRYERLFAQQRATIESQARTLELQDAQIARLCGFMNDVGMLVRSLAVARDQAGAEFGDDHDLMREIDGVIKQVSNAAVGAVAMTRTRAATESASRSF